MYMYVLKYKITCNEWKKEKSIPYHVWIGVGVQ